MSTVAAAIGRIDGQFFISGRRWGRSRRKSLPPAVDASQDAARATVDKLGAGGLVNERDATQ